MVISEQGLTLDLATPNGGEVFQPGQQVNIQWQSAGAISHSVKLSTDGGATFTDISPQLSGSAQSFLWTVPNLSTGQARIRIAARDVLGNRVTDDSSSNFSIQAAAQQQLSVRVLAPNGGEIFQPGQQVSVQWESAGAQSHSVKLSTDGGASFADISPQLPGSAQSFLWTVPNQQTARARIRVAARDALDNRVTDDSDFDFTIQAASQPPLSVTVLTPNGPEVFQPGQQLNIQWQSTGAVSHSVKFSADGGANFVDISPQLSGSAQSFLWTVPNQPTTQARIRVAVRDSSDNRVTDDSNAPFTIQAVAPPLALQVLTPNGGESFLPGQQVNVVWQSAGAVSHEVKFSRDGGATFTDISPQLSGPTQSFVWTVPNQQTTQGRIRVAARDAAGTRVTDESDANFTVAPPPPLASVQVLSPNGGESFQPGQQVSVQWQSAGAVSHEVKFSRDGGATFTDISPTLTGAAQSFLWTVPNQPTGQGVVRVAARDVNGTRTVDDSNAFFTIQAVVPPPTIRVLAPNGGESLRTGAQFLIQWQSTGAASHSVKLSTDNGATFNDISPELPATAQSFLWTVPNQPAAQARIRVAARNSAGARVTDDSDADFKIEQPPPLPTPLTIQVLTPNGPEVFQPGQQVNIQWQSTGAVSHSVKFSADGGANFVDISAQLPGSAQSFLWTVPNRATDKARIRVAARDAAGARATDDSDADFTIEAPPAPVPVKIEVLKPGAGEALKAGQQYTISWQTTGAGVARHVVRYARDGVNFETISEGALPGSARSANWTVPPDSTTAAVVRVIARASDDKELARDDSPAFSIFPAPALRNVSPDNGATQVAGQPPARQVVQLNGLNFRKGGRPDELPKVKFGQVFSEEVTFVDSMTLKALVPPRTTPGSVPVTVVNPDGQSDRLEKGFTYLGPRQAARARVESVSTLTLLEGVRNVGVTLLGRNLKRAYTEGVLCLRGPEGVSVRYENVVLESDSLTQQDKVVFDVFVTAPGLGPLDRVILNVLASVRPNAHKDLLAESSRQMLTLVSSKSPVPLGFTSQVQRGTASPVVVAGRSMKNCRLKSNLPQLTFSPSSSDERFVIALLQVGPNAPDKVSVTLTDENNKAIGTYQINVVDAPVPAPTPSGGYDPVDPDTRLSPVPNQTLPAFARELTRTHPLNPNAPRPVGRADTASSFLTSSVTLSSFTFNIPVLDEVRVLPFFDRSGGTTLVDLPISVKLGRLFGIRGLPLLLVFRLEIEITVSVALVVSVNPFSDVSFGGQSFNEFPDYSPVAGFPGVIVIGIEVRVDITLRVLFLLAIITPDNRFVKVASFLLELGVSTDGKQLELAAGVQLRASVKQALPTAGVDGVVDLIGSAVPLRDPFGTRGYYFARARGRVCLPWLFDLTVARFIGGVREKTPLQSSFAAEICLTINDNRNLARVYIKPDPIVLKKGERATAVAFLKEKDDGIPEGGKPLDAPRQVKFSAETPGLPATVAENGLVEAVTEGVGKITARLTTSGQSFGLFPSSVLGFTTPTQTSPPEALVGTAEVFVGRENVVTLDLIAGPVTRAEPFEPAPAPSTPLSIRLSPSPFTGDFKVRIEARKRTTILDPLQPRLAVMQSPPREVNFDDFFEFKLLTSPKPLTVELNAANTRDAVVVKDFVLTARHREVLRGAPPAGPSKVPPGEVLIKPQGSELFTPSRAGSPKPGEPVTSEESLRPGPTLFTMDVSVISETSGVLLRRSNSPDASDRFNFTLTFEVEEPETYEEYFRVWDAPLQTIEKSTDARRHKVNFKTFQAEFAGALAKFAGDEKAFRVMLETWGKDLWAKGVSAVQTDRQGDRPLYFTRLQAAVSIRKFCASGAGRKFSTKPMTGELDEKKVQELVDIFEDASRGFKQVTFAEAKAGEKKVLLFGFDPFVIYFTPEQGNDSGLLALALKGKRLAAGGVTGYIQSVVLPVRYADFDRGVIERLIKEVSKTAKPDMIVTCSLGRGRYDIERFACRRRDHGGDNNFISYPYNGLDAAVPSNITDGPEFLENTLPYGAILTNPFMTKPASAPASQSRAFLLNQSFKQRDVQKQGTQERSLSDQGTDDAFVPFGKRPSANPKDTARLGSADAFLSNESFYRVTAFFAGDETVACGHLHIPTSTNTDDPAAGKTLAIQQGCMEILKGLISGLALAAKPFTVTFKAKLGASQTETIRVTNNTENVFKGVGRTIRVEQVFLDTPTPPTEPFAVLNPKKGELKLGASLDLCQVVFRPQKVGKVRRAMLVFGPSREPLFRIDLEGEGT